MKKRLVGTVVSDRMDKTRVVEVVRDVRHPVYKKRYKVSKHFYAHDSANQTKIGERVTIEETRPLSKLKRWRIIEHARASSLSLPDTSAPEGTAPVHHPAEGPHSTPRRAPRAKPKGGVSQKKPQEAHTQRPKRSISRRRST